MIYPSHPSIHLTFPHKIAPSLMKMFGFVLYNKFHRLFWPSPIQTLFNLFSKIQKKCVSLYLESKSSHEAIKWMDLTSVTISIVRQCKRFGRSIQSMMAKNHRKRAQPKEGPLVRQCKRMGCRIMSGENHRKRAHPKKEGENVLYFGFPHRKPRSFSTKRRRWRHLDNRFPASLL